MALKLRSVFKQQRSFVLNFFELQQAFSEFCHEAKVNLSNKNCNFNLKMSSKSPLTFKVLSKCSKSKARRGIMMLRETKPVETPGKFFIYFPVLQLFIMFLSLHASWNARNA